MAEEEIQNNQDLDKTSDVKKGRKGIILKIVIIPLALVIQAAAAYFIVFNFLIENPEKSVKSESTEPKDETVGLFWQIKDFVINPAGTQGRRFLVLEMGFETHNSKLIGEAESKKIWIRDAIMQLLVTKTPEELLDFTKRDGIKVEILEAVNSKLKDGTFENLYFLKYIMQ